MTENEANSARRTAGRTGRIRHWTPRSGAACRRPGFCHTLALFLLSTCLGLLRKDDQRFGNRLFGRLGDAQFARYHDVGFHPTQECGCGSPNELKAASRSNEDVSRFREDMQVRHKTTREVLLALDTASLERAELRAAALDGGHLAHANLRGANLTEASLIGASFHGAQLDSANLRGANLRGSNLRGASLRGANLIGADLRGADLMDADLTGADLTGADLLGANLSRSSFEEADLTGALLEGAYLNGADLGSARLDEVSMVWSLYDTGTRWPEQMEPAGLGAVYLPPPKAAAACGAPLRVAEVSAVAAEPTQMGSRQAIAS